MKVTALAGGVGAGKFLRGLIRAVPPRDVTVVVNTADDLELHGLHISPDVDSVTYWLSGLSDRERGWGRADETFRALGEVRRLGGEAWFALGDLDLGIHMTRTEWLGRGASLTEVTDRIRRALGVPCRILPMTDDPVHTWIDAVDANGVARSDPFQVYWVGRGARDDVKSIRLEGAADSAPSEGVMEAVAGADVLIICPSNPAVSIGPILAVPGVRDAVAARRDRVVGISPIVGGAPVQGMADRLMPVLGLEVTAAGAARAYRGLLGGWVIDRRDAGLRSSIQADLEIAVGTTDTIMVDDGSAERLAGFALELIHR
jgi:LPPG:FO 2-phospho-L-lactate transferase